MFLGDIADDFLKVMLAVDRHRRLPGDLVVTDIQLLADVWDALGIEVLNYVRNDIRMLTGVDDQLKGRPSSTPSGMSMNSSTLNPSDIVAAISVVCVPIMPI